MRAVSITEFRDWLKKPEVIRHTWLHGSYGIKDRGSYGIKDRADDFKEVKTANSKDKTMLAKYFDLNLDTRDMLIWQICIRRGNDVVGIRDSSDDNGKTILDGLLEQLIEMEKKAT